MMIQPLVRRSSASRLHPAFTLVEVLVVMAILVIIAGAGAFGAFAAMDMARKNEAKIKMEKIASGVQVFNTQYGQFPESVLALVQPGPDGTDPIIVGGESAVTDPWGSPFTFQITQDNTGATRVLVTCQGKNGNNQFTWPEK